MTSKWQLPNFYLLFPTSLKTESSASSTFYLSCIRISKGASRMSMSMDTGISPGACLVMSAHTLSVSLLPRPLGQHLPRVLCSLLVPARPLIFKASQIASVPGSAQCTDMQCTPCSGANNKARLSASLFAFCSLEIQSYTLRAGGLLSKTLRLPNLGNSTGDAISFLHFPLPATCRHIDLSPTANVQIPLSYPHTYIFWHFWTSTEVLTTSIN